MFLNKNFDKALENILQSNEFLTFFESIKSDYSNKKVYPDFDNIFRCYKMLDIDEIKVVILGQDPYHDGSADGLCFSNSLKKDTKSKISPSLLNINKEIEIEYNIKRNSSSLENWAKQGVFLLNTILTVEEHKPLSYKDSYWIKFTEETIKAIEKYNNNVVVYLLFGSYSHKYEKLITNKNHHVVKTFHPSPLSAYRGFFNSNCFKKVNKIFADYKLSEVDFTQ